MSRPDSPTEPLGAVRRRRFWLTIGGAALVVAVAGGIALALVLGPAQPSSAPNGAGGTPGSTPSASASPEASASGPAPEETVDPDFGEPVADSVAPDEVADFGDAVTARLVAVTPYTATASQAGEVSGPAVLVEVELRNDTGGAIPLDAVTVNCYYGSDRIPASPVTSDPSARPFVGSLETGTATRAVYVFSVSEGQPVTVTVSKDASSPLVVFQ